MEEKHGIPKQGNQGMKILLVDDEIRNLKLLEDVLIPLGYQLFKALDADSALKIVRKNSDIDLILLDIMMPVMDGFEVCRILKSDELTKKIPVIFLTALKDDVNQVKGLTVGAVDYISKPFKLEVLEARVKTHLDLRWALKQLEEINLNLENLVLQRTKELILTQEVTIESMGALAEYRDKETGKHIIRTKVYVKELATFMKGHPRFKDYLDDKTIGMLYLSAPLHIILKQGKLTEAEFAEMKKHAIYGRDILTESEKKLSSSSFLRCASEMAGTHHEKWDGTGYPLGLKGDTIPIPGRLMALADVYDALVSERPYKVAFPHEKAAHIIKEGRGTHFDPDIVDAFIALENKFKEIALSPCPSF